MYSIGNGYLNSRSKVNGSVTLGSTRLLTPPKMSFPVIYVLGKNYSWGNKCKPNAFNLILLSHSFILLSFTGRKRDFFMKILWQEKILIKCR